MSIKAFPRGSISSSAPDKLTKDDVSKESLFGKKRTRTVEVVPTKAKKIKSASASTSLLGVGLGMTKTSSNNKVIKIETLNFAKYSKGTLVFAYVLRFTDSEVVLSLPGGLTGTVIHSEISDVIYNSFQSKITTEKNNEEIPEIKSLIILYQCVRCVVIDKKEFSQKGLSLSMRSSLVNRGIAFKHFLPGFPISGCIASKEDHGYVVSAGIGGSTLFLPFKGISADLIIGQPVDCVVDTVSDTARTAKLRLGKKVVTEAITRGSLLSFNAIVPGMLFNVTVESIIETGLVVRFLDSFFGSIDCFSLARPQATKTLSATFTLGDSLQARVVFVDHGSKAVRLSLRPHVLDMDKPLFLPPLGSLVENLTVLASNNFSGVFSTTEVLVEESVDLAEGEKQSKKAAAAAARLKQRREDASLVGVLVHRSGLADLAGDEDTAPSDQIEKQYKVGSSLSAVRVLGYHLVEGVVTGSALQKRLADSVLHSSQLRVGMVLEAQIKEVRDDGLVLSVNDRVSAFCPTAHLFDTGAAGGLLNATNKGKQRYKLGSSVPVRVWSIKDNAVIVTCKKSLLDLSAERVVSSYGDLRAGRACLGVVTDLSSRGVRVHFFGGVRGVIPASVLHKQGVERGDVADTYRLGRLVQCIVLSSGVGNTGTEKKSVTARAVPRVLLGLDIGDSADVLRDLRDEVKQFEAKEGLAADEPEDADGAEADTVEADKGAAAVQSARDVHSGVITKIDLSDADAGKHGLYLALDCGREGFVHKHQCFDLASTAEVYFSGAAGAGLAVGSKIKDALLLQTTRGVLQLTMKPLLCRIAARASLGADSVPSRLSELTPGLAVAGYVFKVEPFGVLVRFRGGLTALAPRSNIADRFVSSPVGMFHLGDSVRCVVQGVDLAQERAIVTFKSQRVPSALDEDCYLSARLREAAILATKERETKANSVSKVPFFQAYSIGAVLSVVVTAIKPYGVVMIAAIIYDANNKPVHDDSNAVFLARGAHADRNVPVGQTAKVRLLDIDYSTGVFDVSMDATLTSHGHGANDSNEKASKKKKKKKDSDGQADAVDAPATLDADLTTGAALQVRVELVRKNYLVTSYGTGKHLLYVSVADYHAPYLDTSTSAGYPTATPAETDQADNYTLHQEVSVKVTRGGASLDPRLQAAFPRQAFPHDAVRTAAIDNSKEMLTRSLSLSNMVESTSSTVEAASANKNKFVNDYRLYKVCQWVVVSVGPLEATLRPAVDLPDNISLRAILHITGAVNQVESDDGCAAVLEAAEERCDDPLDDARHPFHNISVGQKLAAKIQHLSKDTIEAQGSETVSPRKDQERLLAYVSIPAQGQSGSSAWGVLHQWEGKNCIQSKSLYAFVVTKIDVTGVMLSLSPFVRCRLHYAEVSDHRSLIKKFQKYCFVGQRLVCAVSGLSKQREGDKGKITRTLSVSRTAAEAFLSSLSSPLSLAQCKSVDVVAAASTSHKVGTTLYGVVLQSGVKVPNPPALCVSLAGQQMGRVCLTEAADPADWAESSAWEEGSLVKCKVLSVGEGGKWPELSMRPSRLAIKKRSASVTADPLPAQGQVVNAFVANVSSKGCFLRLSHELTGLVLIKDMADEFLQSPAAAFPVGKLVQTRVLSISQTDSMAKLSLRPSVVVGDEAAAREIAQLGVGQLVTGKVQKIAPIGVFVSIDDTSLVGLSRKICAVANEADDLAAFYSVGDVVRARVLSLSASSKKVALGLKASYFRHQDDSDEEEAENVLQEDGQGEAEDSEEADEDNAELLEEMAEDSDEDEELEALIKGAALPDESDDDEEEAGQSEVVTGPWEQDDGSDDELPAGPLRALPDAKAMSEGPLLLWDDFKPVGKDWKSAAATVPEDDSDEDEEGDHSSKKRKRDKKNSKQQQELETLEKERILSAGGALPERVQDFEKLLLASPNSSYLWVQLMAHHLKNVQVEAARATADRAIRTIAYREEDEKYNVWLAWLNVEHKYGDKASFEAVFKRAVSESKGKYVHLQLAQMFESAEDFEATEQMLEKTLKKYKYSKKVWSSYQVYLLRRGEPDRAKVLLSRSMQSLSRHKHIEVIQKYALAEFDYGSSDRGRVLFNELMATYPKRTDIWHLYVDKEIKSGHVNQARQLFDRMINSKASTMNMKTVFKKYLSFEVQHGSKEQQDTVKQKAREYVTALMR